jgi:hypothetical protein
MVLYWERKNISVYNCDALAFLRELNRRYQEVRAVLDRSQHWAFPGLHYFKDDPVDRALFFGREKEIQRLTERIIAEDLTVLFGKSGDGKTSLINAGLKWAFRELGSLPVRARIFNLPEQTPLAVLYQAIADEAKLNEVTLPPNWQRETLWESFLALRPTEENRLKPIVLILDQFEELFTLMAGRGQEQEDFIAQFADLVRAFAGNVRESIAANWPRCRRPAKRRANWNNCFTAQHHPPSHSSVAARRLSRLFEQSRQAHPQSFCQSLSFVVAEHRASAAGHRQSAAARGARCAKISYRR